MDPFKVRCVGKCSNPTLCQELCPRCNSLIQPRKIFRVTSQKFATFYFFYLTNVSPMRYFWNFSQKYFHRVLFWINVLHCCLKQTPDPIKIQFNCHTFLDLYLTLIEIKKMKNGVSLYYSNLPPNCQASF